MILIFIPGQIQTIHLSEIVSILLIKLLIYIFRLPIRNLNRNKLNISNYYLG